MNLGNNNNVLNTNDSFNNISGNANIPNHYNIADQQSETLRWLSPLDPRVRHHDIQAGRAESVGEWLLETSEFQSWSDGGGEGSPENPALFCYGGAGVGKTYISSLVIDRLGDQAKERHDFVACFYFDFTAQKEQSPANMLGSLLKQIVGGLERVPEDVLKAFEDQKKAISGRRLRVPEIVKLLQTVTSSRRTFICVDALDECLEKHQSDILDSLREILDKSPGTRVFITSRRHVSSQIEKHLAGKAVALPMKPNNEDIREYIRMKLRKDAFLGAMDDILETEITNTLAERIPESLLLVSITLDSILRETTVYTRWKKLSAMAEGSEMKDVYGATLERIQGQGGERARLGMGALLWISHSEKPLQLDELLEALAVENESTALNPERISSVEILLSCCLGLVTFDKEASRVCLIHFSLQEYLYTRPDVFPSAHSTIAETCLTYLNFRHVRDLSSTLDSAPPSAPFLTYCSLYWGVHARKESSSSVISLAFELFSEFENHLSTQLPLTDMKQMLGWMFHIPSNVPRDEFTGLHCASFFDIVEIAKIPTEKEHYDLNKRDCMSVTPLIWAAAAGQEGVVKLLLQQRNVDPNKADKVYRRTALSWAAGHGDDAVVKELLSYGSHNPNGAGGAWGKTSQVIKVFSGKKFVKCDKPDKCGSTPLWRAAHNGHEGVVKLLLSRKDVNPDRPDKDGATPFWGAAWSGHEGVVKLLLRWKDVNPDRPDKYGETPLWWAAYNGHEGVAKILLSREDVNPDRPDKDGETPLWGAVRNGHEGVMKLLLSRENVNPNDSGKYGDTPLCWAVYNGHEGVVKLLLGRKDVNPDKEDRAGQTPLLGAVRYGRWGVVKLLLSQEDVNPGRPNKYGTTPLLRAAENGHEGVVKLLLVGEDVNPNKPDKDGRTPLLRAAENVHEGVVKLLLSRDDVNPNKPDKDGETPLFAAAKHGSESVVKLLLERAEVDPLRSTTSGETPLSIAVKSWNSLVEQLLRARIVADALVPSSLEAEVP